MRSSSAPAAGPTRQWKGSFYPADLPADDMLRHYAGRLPAVEINNSFYRIPKEKVLLDWAEQVPPAFRFVLKASRTHHPHQPPVARGRLARLFPADRQLPRGAAGPDPVPVPALAPQEHGAAARLPRPRCRAPGGRRWSSGTSRGTTTRCTTRSGPTTWRWSGWRRTSDATPLVPDRVVGLSAAPQDRIRRGRAARLGRTGCARSRGARRTCS